MVSLILTYAPVGIICGMAVAVALTARLIVKSNDMGNLEEEAEKPDYIDKKSVQYHAVYDSQSPAAFFDGEYK